jgi:hypothetical protein
MTVQEFTDRWGEERVWLVAVLVWCSMKSVYRFRGMPLAPGLTGRKPKWETRHSGCQMTAAHGARTDLGLQASAPTAGVIVGLASGTSVTDNGLRSKLIKTLGKWLPAEASGCQKNFLRTLPRKQVSNLVWPKAYLLESKAR